MLAISGFGSRITAELLPLLPAGESVCRFDAIAGAVDPATQRYLLAGGVLFAKRRSELTPQEFEQTWQANAAAPIRAINTILAVQPKARIVVIGSESGFTGSHNELYAEAKASLHHYVEHRPLGPDQQLVCVAPSIIGDAGMTTRRTDTANLARRRATHPKRRFLDAVEVARLVHFLLYVDSGYLSGVTIRMNGGAHTQ